ncbi:radical SAM protein [Treponema zioleckii]|uniref:radical SAM protein n=1 Tax=Treponema zioleckii TaxID=331680 RepID=UPI00168BBD70|nr:radical SAM protein [Treponema zioleckii]
MARVIDKDWRKKEESFREIIKKYPEISPFIITQLDVQRRGVTFTSAALDRVDPSIHQTRPLGERLAPDSLLLRDGTSIVTNFTFATSDGTISGRDPYLVDVVDGKTVLTDNGDIIDEIIYWEKPEYYDKVTSFGNKMGTVIRARPQRFHLDVNHYCHFWDVGGEGCKYCGIGAEGHKYKGASNEHANYDEIREVMQELVKEKGRFTGFILTGGSVLSGKELCDDELEQYIQTMHAIGSVFSAKKFPSQINSTALNVRQLERLYNETGLTSYTTDLEVFDEEVHKWVCPGKARLIPFKEWKKRLYDAVPIFGKGQVNTGIVSGVELAEPNGFKSEAEAIARNLETAEELTSHGVGLKHDVWNVVPNSIFKNQSTPSLNYYVQITKGFYELNLKYGINTEMDDYRKCSMHANINHDRI